MQSTKHTHFIFISLFILSVLSCSLLPSCEKSSYQRYEGMIWNTMFHITYNSPHNLNDSIIEVLNDVEMSLSVFNQNSLVAKVNENTSTEVDSNFIKVYDKSVEINHKSGGYFDPTLSPLIKAWGFQESHTINADTAAIDSIRQFVGISKTRREGTTLIKDDIRTQFNFSAIAKGYGCDAVAEMFRRNNVKDFMIEIGGEITLAGKSPSGGKWKISIDAPIFEDNNMMHESSMVIGVTDCGIATSGNYRNYNMAGNERYGHTISPFTGRPAQTDILSATVIAHECMEADAVATSCMAAGFSEAKKLISSLKLDACLILTDSIWMSPGFAAMVISEVAEPGRTDRN